MSASNNTRILAIDPASRGFGYAVLEGGAELIDWGVAATNNRLVAERFNALLKRFAPEIVVIRGTRRGMGRTTNAELTAGIITQLCKTKGLSCRIVDKRRLAKNFQVGPKDAVAASIAARFPELAGRLPRPRKPWMSEDYRMSIFDAVSVGITAVEPASGRGSETGREPAAW